VAKALSERADRFCLEYVKDLNATRAALRAGYSRKTAYSQAYRLLKNVGVRRRLKKLIDRRAQRSMVKAEDVLEELRRLGFSCPAEFASFGPKGVKLKDSSKLSPEQLAAVAEVAQVDGPAGRRNIRLKFHDKVAALRLLGEHLGVFKKDLFEGESYQVQLNIVKSYDGDKKK